MQRSDPRPSNHGGHTPTPPAQPATLEAGLGARFDWYEATADGLDDGRVSAALALATGAQLERGKGRNGYARADVVLRNDDVLATVYGGSSREGEIHVAITSEACDEVVPIFRRLYPNHRCSRVDSALDFISEFASLDSLAVEFAESRGLKHRLFTNSDGGATRYIGAQSSEMMLRLYKKSEQLQQLHPERAGDIPDGIVRAELVARPGKRAAKESVANLDAGDVWGLGAWSREFATTILDFDPVRTSTHFRRPSDWARALHFLGQQYRPSVERRVESRGRDAVVLEVLDALGLL